MQKSKLGSKQGGPCSVARVLLLELEEISYGEFALPHHLGQERGATLCPSFDTIHPILAGTPVRYICEIC